MIGSQQIKGLSGGERKRTAIGVELITNPSVIFLDEPTSGLDSFTANSIVKLLVQQSRLGKTIVATIHQPSSSTYALFDRLLLLMEGHPIYQGPANEAVSYFGKIGYQIATYANPADYFLKQFYMPHKRTEEDEQKLSNLIDGYNQHLLQTVADQNEQIKLDELDDVKIQKSFATVSYCSEQLTLINRTVKNLYRDPQSSQVRIMQLFIMSILMILTFWDLPTDELGQMDRAGFLFFLCVDQVMTGIYSVILTFLIEREVFLREYANKMYGVIPYFFAKSLIDIPFQALLTIITCCCVYFAVGLTEDADKFFIFFLIVFLAVFTSSSFGLFVGCAVNNPNASTALVNTAVLPFIIFGGFFVNLDDVYDWIGWMQYLSPIRYALEALLRNEFEGNDRYSGERPYDKFHMDIGLTECIVILISLGVTLRIGALILLKLTAQTVQ